MDNQFFPKDSLFHQLCKINQENGFFASNERILLLCDRISSNRDHVLQNVDDFYFINEEHFHRFLNNTKFFSDSCIDYVRLIQRETFCPLDEPLPPPSKKLKKAVSSYLFHLFRKHPGLTQSDFFTGSLSLASENLNTLLKLEHDHLLFVQNCNSLKLCTAINNFINLKCNVIKYWMKSKLFIKIISYNMDQHGNSVPQMCEGFINQYDTMSTKIESIFKTTSQLSHLWYNNLLKSKSPDPIKRLPLEIYLYALSDDPELMKQNNLRQQYINKIREMTDFANDRQFFLSN